MAKHVHINQDAVAWADQIITKEHRRLIEGGNESYFFWGRGVPSKSDTEVNFNRKYEPYVAAAQTRVDGRDGFHSKAATRRLLKRLDEIEPDYVHLHNLHGYYLNIETLFQWLAKSRCKVEWTLHDCWAFTGHCAYFTYVKCAQWKTHCAHREACPQLDTYPKTISKSSVTWNFVQKKRLFTLLPAERMSLVTPSQWLADLVGQSFLSKYPVRVRHNTVDTGVFKPTPSDFRERYGIGDRFMILGVASPWTERKGLSVFIRLAEELDDSCAIVLVGLSKKQIAQMPGKVVGIERTENAGKLAAAYTSADVHLQPSIEETFGMTVVESLACGTPVVVRKGSACEEAADRVPGVNAQVFSDFDGLKATIMQMQGGALMVCFERTESQQQLAALYTAADVFFNPTREDNYPTVLLEASACGAAICTYDVGGCKEAVVDGCPTHKVDNSQFDQIIHVGIGSSLPSSSNERDSGLCPDIF